MNVIAIDKLIISIVRHREYDKILKVAFFLIKIITKSFFFPNI